MTTETAESPSKRLPRLEADYREVQNAHKSVLDTFDKAKSKATTEELLALAKDVESKATAMGRIEAQVNVCKREIQHQEWEAKSQELRAATSAIVDAISNAVNAAGAVLAKFQVNGLAIDVSALGQPDQIISVKPRGEGIPKAPAKRGSGGGGGGGGRGVPLTVNGTEHASASAALLAIEPGFEGKMGREAIIARLRHAGHTVTE